MTWSRSQKPCETVRSILAKTSSLDVTNPVYGKLHAYLHHIDHMIWWPYWSGAQQVFLFIKPVDCPRRSFENALLQYFDHTEN